ncbi:hypothetical protein ASF60_01420 [Methylobacterium sp. Leaf113]|nr:hypothetical protein ASF60_01420 [Methylobacterium sp. Leaf113]
MQERRRPGESTAGKRRVNPMSTERDWSVAVAATPDGVRIEIGLPDLDGRPVTAILALDREEARTLARALLAASGDAMERTFPRAPGSAEG